MVRQRKLRTLLALALLWTVVSCRPTATPTPLATPTSLPTPTAEPEVLATRNEDVVGVWLMVASPSDGMYPTRWHVEHTLDGARNHTNISGLGIGTHGEGQFWFEGGLYKVQIPQGTEDANSTAIGTYQVFVTKRGGKPVRLRFVVVDDPYIQRKDRLTYKPLTLVER